MSTDHWIVLRLEVDRDADPIAGSLSEHGAEPRSFTGWLGLTDAIEAIRTAHMDPRLEIEDHAGAHRVWTGHEPIGGA